MIDKSIRQHYQNGKEVGPFKRGMEMIMPKLKAQALPQEGKTLPNIIRAPLQRAALSKLGLGALNPVLGLLSLLGIDPIAWLSKKMTQGGVQQAFQAGFGSPQEGRELRQLENRRANMLQRKEEGRNYSEKNLDIVTRAIAEAKGLDINNPNEMRNIDKPIQQIQIEKSVTEAPQIIPEEPEVKSPFAKVIPKTPDIISPHLEGAEIMSTPKVIPKTPEIISPHLEGDRTISTPIVKQLPTDFAFEDAKRAAANRAAANRAAEEKAAANRIMQETIAKAERDAAAARATISVQVPAHIREGGGEGSQGTARGDPGGGVGGLGGHGPARWAKGGRIDKALGGRIRDI